LLVLAEFHAWESHDTGIGESRLECTSRGFSECALLASAMFSAASSLSLTVWNFWPCIDSASDHGARALTAGCDRTSIQWKLSDTMAKSKALLTHIIVS
jgi:hypothetical protein